MVEAELGYSRADAGRLEAAATAAEAASKAQLSALDALKAKGKAKVASLRVQSESEASIVDEQASAVRARSEWPTFHGLPWPSVAFRGRP